ncbi:MAG: glycosyltransferase family 4 protein [Longimicrobiales bacterium]
MADAQPTPLRVCQLISSFYPEVGGAEQATLRLSTELDKRGCTVCIVTRRYPGLAAHAEVEGLQVLRAGIPSRSKLGALSYLVHALFLLATRLRGYAVVHAQGPDTQLITALLAKRVLGRRMVFTIHSDPLLQLRIKDGAGGPRFKAVKRWADRIGVLGSHVARTLEANGIPSKQIIQLPNGVNTERFRPAEGAERETLRRELGISEGEVAGVFVGRLIGLKRVDLLIRAWVGSGASEKGPLFIVGDGPEDDALKALAAELGTNRVHFLGPLKAPERVLKGCDLFALPSQREGQSVALLEAMACGLVPVVSDLEPNTAVVENGVNGFVFSTDNQAELERTLTTALDSDLHAIGDAAQAHVRARNSLDKVAETHLSLYRKLTAPDGGR